MRESSGFTIVEFMVAIVIVAVVVGIGAPNFSRFLDNSSLISQFNQTMGMIAMARSEAAKRPNTTITLCGSNNVTAATPACNTNNWENGWLIFSDVDADAVIDAGTDELIRIGEPMGNTLRTNGFASAGSVQFDAAGVPGSTGTFTICDDRGTSEARAIVISIAGQSRSAVDQDGDGVVNDHAGVNVTCP